MEKFYIANETFNNKTFNFMLLDPIPSDLPYLNVKLLDLLTEIQYEYTQERSYRLDDSYGVIISLETLTITFFNDLNEPTVTISLEEISKERYDLLNLILNGEEVIQDA